MILVNGRQLTISSFPNGERRISLPSNTLLTNNNKKNVVVWQYEDDGDFMLINMVSEYIKRNDNKDTGCIILSMPYERMDRSENGSVCSLEVAVGLLPTDWDYVVIAPHSGKISDYFNSRKLKLQTVEPLKYIISCIKKVLVEETENSPKTALVFPDKGAYMRYGSNISNIVSHIGIQIQEILYGEKTRNFVTGEIEGLDLLDQNDNKVESLKGYSAIVIDDLSSYGGTFIKIHNLLNAMGVEKSFLVLEKSEDSILKGDLIGKYDKIFTTDLMMKIVSDKTFVPELEIISSKEILNKMTQRIGGFK